MRAIGVTKPIGEELYSIWATLYNWIKPRTVIVPGRGQFGLT